jgi:hypothetical protein
MVSFKIWKGTRTQWRCLRFKADPYLPSTTLEMYKSMLEKVIHFTGTAQHSQPQGHCAARRERNSSPDLSVDAVVEKNLEKPGCAGGARVSPHLSSSDTHSPLSHFHSSGRINIRTEQLRKLGLDNYLDEFNQNGVFIRHKP